MLACAFPSQSFVSAGGGLASLGLHWIEPISPGKTVSLGDAARHSQRAASWAITSRDVSSAAAARAMAITKTHAGQPKWSKIQPSTAVPASPPANIPLAAPRSVAAARPTKGREGPHTDQDHPRDHKIKIGASMSGRPSAARPSPLHAAGLVPNRAAIFPAKGVVRKDGAKTK
jgi:hypothetical protein